MKSRKALILIFLAMAVFSGFAFAQEAQAPAAGEAAPIHEKSLLDKFEEGGVVMFPLLGCSILTLYLIIDGVLKTSNKRVLPPEHVEGVKNAFRQGDYVGAYNFCKVNPSPFTNVCKSALGMLGEGKTAVEEATIGELAKESSQMMFYISYLSVIGVCTPMIGLLGTVSGMIKAFDKLGTSGIGDPSGLAAAIGEVLVATFTGLAVAIPAFAAYYYLRNRATKAIHDIQDCIAVMFRKMPYEQLAGAHISDEELVAAVPNWVPLTDTAPGEVGA